MFLLLLHEWRSVAVVLAIYLVNAGFDHLGTIVPNTSAYDTVQSLAQVQKHGAYSTEQAHAAT
jgi:hypothetical protein